MILCMKNTTHSQTINTKNDYTVLVESCCMLFSKVNISWNRYCTTMAGPGIISFPRTEKYSVKLADNIMTLRNEKTLMDFKICSKDETIPCNKFVMAAQSPMLRAMLTSDMAEVAKQEIRLDHMDLEIIQIILDYMYCKDVSVHKDQLMALISVSDYFQMTDLKEMCLDEVPAILEHANVIITNDKEENLILIYCGLQNADYFIRVY